MSFFDRLRDDVSFLKGATRSLRKTTPIARNPTRIFPTLIDELVERFAERPALISEHETLTYRALGERSNRYARWARAQGLARGDVVCLLMPNCPDYIAFWIGVTRVGGVVALLNTNLTGPSLAHCIDIVKPKHVIVASELARTLLTAEPHLATRPQVWIHGEGPGQFSRIDRAIAALAGDALSSAERPTLTIDDKALFIYTSGTTGMPKAANVNHYRIMLASCGFAGVMDTKADDRMYDCLPMYHTVGGLVAPGALLVVGGAVVIREKFSARQFWDDVVRYDCTMFQYIGELCRYLLNSPPSENERRHRLRLACGNGLRPDIWAQFKDRFRIPQIVEFYGATEGNVLLFNFTGKPGAIGRIPWYVARRFPVALIRFDVEKDRPIRDESGFCIRCRPGESGEAIGKIINDSAKPTNRFEGYADPSEDERKILHDVFTAGDAWFRSGDLMRQDRDGYFYFVDRIGDTFRWKGENVSTTEVAEAINCYPGVENTNVYGVPVAGCDGRAGMAAIVSDHNLDLSALRSHLQQRLPAYARPLFLRIHPEFDVTATFKQRKLDLVKQAFDPNQTSDAIYFDDPRAGAFVRLDVELYQRIQSGQVKL